MKQKPINKERGERFRFLREDVLGIPSQEQFAREIGVERGAVGNWELGGGVKAENIFKIAARFNVSVEWLAHGLGDPPSRQKWTTIKSRQGEHLSSEDVAAAMGPSQTRENNGYSTLENYKGDAPGAVPEIDARAGAGDGSVGEGELVSLRRGEAYVGHKVTAEWVFPSAFLRHELHVQPGGIMVLEVVGDSMSPTLESGDRVIIDTRHARPTPDGVYVIDEGDGPMVKRLQLIRRSDPAEIRVISDNSRHEAYTLRLDDVRIIGRVSGRVTRM